MSRSVWVILAILMAAVSAPCELKLRFFADFEHSVDGPADKENLQQGTECGNWNARIRSGSVVTNGVLLAGPGRYGFQLWIPPSGIPLSALPSIHIEFLAATTIKTGQWNQIFIKDTYGRTLLSLRFNSWSAIQRWTGSDWEGPLGISQMRGSRSVPLVLNELDIDLFPESADIYYNGAMIEHSVSYLDNVAPVLRRIILSGMDDDSTAFFDNIKVDCWSRD